MRANFLMFLAQSKGHTMLTSVCENGNFVMTCENDIELTNSDFTEEEIAQGWIDYQAKEAADRTKAEAKKQELLNKLGITADEAKLLLANG
jgi:hypothetical protein